MKSYKIVTKYLVLIASVLALLSGCAATGESEDTSLKLASGMVLPHYLPGAGALSDEVTEFDRPRGKRVLYFAPRLTLSTLVFQSYDKYYSKEKTSVAEALNMAKANVLNLRRQGIHNTSFMGKSTELKMGNTMVAYNRVVRGDNKKTLHLYFTKYGDQLFFVQGWSDSAEVSDKGKLAFDTFVFNLILYLEKKYPDKPKTTNSNL